MKHILTPLLLFGFLILSFHAPTSGNYQALAEQIAINPPKKPVTVEVRFPTKEQVSAAVHSFAYTVAEADLKIDDGRGNIISTREMGNQFVNTVRTSGTSQIADSAMQLIRLKMEQAKDLKSLIRLEPDETLRQKLQVIDWAIRKADTGACKELIADTVQGTEPPAGQPGTGDLLAYCIARVTGAKERCLQIADSISLPLKSLCKREIDLQTR